MATDNDDRDEKSDGSDDGCVCISRCDLGYLFSVTGEKIDFEDHEEFVVVVSNDLTRRRKLAYF